MDTSTYIANQVKSLMEIVQTIDPYMPEEDGVAVLVDAFNHWAVIENDVLLPVLRLAEMGDEVDTMLDKTVKRIETMQNLQNDLEAGEGAELPFSAAAITFMDALKYHLLVDVQDIAPLAASLPEEAQTLLIGDMAMRKRELEDL